LRRLECRILSRIDERLRRRAELGIQRRLEIIGRAMPGTTGQGLPCDKRGVIVERSI
jgi:hypothetical protein